MSLRAERGNLTAQAGDNSEATRDIHLASHKDGTLYIGVTSTLIGRTYQHKNKLIIGFAERYGCKKLVYYEIYEDMENAILREKQLKGGSRKKKIVLIESINPEWKDLWEEIIK